MDLTQLLQRVQRAISHILHRHKCEFHTEILESCAEVINHSHSYLYHREKVHTPIWIRVKYITQKTLQKNSSTQ